jgi:hypothetical protein
MKDNKTLDLLRRVFLVGSMLLIFVVFAVVLLRFFTLYGP